MLTLKDKLQALEQRIDDACRRAHRDPKSVTLLPVSKTFEPEVIRQAVSLGLKRFGENRLQEIAHKAPALADCSVQWVVIGSVQTNKAKEVAKYASELQSLDRMELALALDKRLAALNRTLDVLVQVKTSPEESKSGIEPALLADFLRQLSDIPTLNVKGLMTMAVLSDDSQAVRQCFKTLAQLQKQMQSLAIPNISLDRLSMGMSGDFEIAIQEGSTEIRVGSALFGAR